MYICVIILFSYITCTYSCIFLESVSELPPGDYISCGSVLKLKVELTYPLTLENNDLLTSPKNSIQCTISSVSLTPS